MKNPQVTNEASKGTIVRMNNLIIRSIEEKDKEAILEVERQSTPNLQYLPDVFELFKNDEQGQFFLAELNSEPIACAKFTLLANNSAWLETVRVKPKYQGLGVGKKLYQHFFKLAKEKSIGTMRMYTGQNNQVSKGLAEHNDFRQEAGFKELSWQATSNTTPNKHNFQQVKDETRASDLIMPYADQWQGFAVINRTFYKWSPKLCQFFARQGFVYEDVITDSFVVFGSRFSPEKAQFLAMFEGDAADCLSFAKQETQSRNAAKLTLDIAKTAVLLEDWLLEEGFKHSADLIVMKANI